MSRWFGRRKEEKPPPVADPAPVLATDTFAPEVSGNVIENHQEFRWADPLPVCRQWRLPAGVRGRRDAAGDADSFICAPCHSEAPLRARVQEHSTANFSRLTHPTCFSNASQ